MPLYNKLVDEIILEDIEALKTNREQESKVIEYKEQLPDAMPSSKKALLESVSSFANAIGGDLLYGIEADKGVPLNIKGLEIDDVDAKISSLQNMIRDGIRPRITLDIQRRELSNGRVVLILRVRRGLAPPHQIVFDKDFRFYTRDSNGKHRLDVDELRVMFDLSGTLAERIREFRAARLAQVVSGETPVLLDAAAKLVLHLIPASAFDPAQRPDIRQFADDLQSLRPIATYASNLRRNFDGLLRYHSGSQGQDAGGYVQLFKNGIIEAVDASILEGKDQNGNGTIPSTYLENKLIEVLPKYLSIQEQLRIEPPILIMLSLLGVKRFSILPGERYIRQQHQTVDRDDLLIPAIEIEGYKVNSAEVLRPAFDDIWAASGWERSMNYDEQGKRNK